jgi:two-component system, sensor histidine kinase YesM
MFIVVAVFMAVLYIFIVNSSEKAALSNQMELTGKTTEQLESYLNEMDNIALQAMSNPQLLKYFIDLASDDDPANYFRNNALDYIDAGSILATINGPYNTVGRISAYNWHGDYISAGILFESNDRIAETLQNSINVNQWILALEKSNTKRIVLGPHNDFWSQNTDYRFISIIRPLSNIYSTQIFGVVEVQQDVKKLESLLSMQMASDRDVLVFDSDGNLLLSSGNDQQAVWRATEYFDQVNQYIKDNPKDVSAYTSLKSQHNEYLTFGISKTANWIVVLVQSRRALLKPYATTLIALVVGSILVFLIMIMIVYIVSGRLSKPIRQMSESFKNVSLLNLSIDVEYDKGNNEIARLDSAFQAMFKKMGEAIKLEMKAYLLALQSQMNPHFLYNMLSVISASGQEAGNAKTMKMCTMLSDMLRYAASFEDIDTTIGEEVQHTRNYLDLMKERFEENFSYTITVGGGIEQMSILKLILQPIVENSFQHGFKSVRPPWKIDIDIGRDAAQWWVCVTDNGSGMTMEERQQIAVKIEQFSHNITESYPAMKLGGLGLVNTIIRLKLLYDESVHYSIESAKGIGTTITIGGNVQ